MSATRLAVVGNPVSHSRSPQIHARFAQAIGLDVDYTRIEAPLDGFVATLRAFADAGARGCNVTVPFKGEAFAACARLSERARRAQAVNTIVFESDGWFGDNTDGAGLVRDIELNAGVPLQGKRVLLLGAGGAAAGALDPLLAARPAALVVANRTSAKAQALIERFAAGAARLDVPLSAAPSLEAPGTGFDVLVNATAASLQAAVPALPAGTLRPGALALDMMYGAAALPFLRWARSQGAVARDGLGMLVEQASEAFFVWMGQRPATFQVLADLRREVDAQVEAAAQGVGVNAGVRNAGRLVGMLAVATLALQLFFLLRIALMTVVAPESTTFQRSEIWRLVLEKHQLPWLQESVPAGRISDNLRRAVIASEDAGFVEHHGVEWDAVEKAWSRNEKAHARAEAQQNRAATRRGRDGKPREVVAKVVGGSTISQQLAKNLFLSGERNILRKGQELAITFMLEFVLGKDRILTTYLNNVEWGEGVFGAQAASEHYFRTNAATLGAAQAARLAVMLPAPKRFEKAPSSPYVLGRSATIVARMGGVDLP